MVNRVLIRLKVVQLLYSYLLSKSDFNIEMPQQTSSPDRRYAYSAYARLLLLLLQLCGVNVTKTYRYVPCEEVSSTKYFKNKLALALSENADVRKLIDEYAAQMAAFIHILPEVTEKICNLPDYAAFCKVKVKERTPSDYIQLWSAAMRMIVRLPEVTNTFRNDPEFTLRGIEMAGKMVLATVQNFGDTTYILSNARKDLRRSLDEAYNLYHWLLWLPVEITRTESDRLDANASKYLPTEDDLHPDRRFVDSKLVDVICSHQELQDYINDKGINWHEDIALIPRLTELVISSEPYHEFMAKPGEKTIEEEAELWRTLFKQIILPSEDLAEALENLSIFWNDDLEIMGSFAMKTLRRLAVNPQEPLQPEFKDQEDEEFGTTLFDAAVAHHEQYRALIDEFVNNKKWDADRIALMDTVILEAALAETTTFPNIPLSVTTNEYVEIANWYSTSRSGSFVNGMLASISEKLRNEGSIIKKFN
ncbi:MAG: hypothetical protein NC301_03715 [Bacteroides sp.]|nr:hypothetical protein [Bacteroides sp.]MCM1378705.1 hypothetical protein [Bacteroides sp.]MCM1444978.1 hypothetical protein [Prevotella sp.]